MISCCAILIDSVHLETEAWKCNDFVRGYYVLHQFYLYS